MSLDHDTNYEFINTVYSYTVLLGVYITSYNTVLQQQDYSVIYYPLSTIHAIASMNSYYTGTAAALEGKNTVFFGFALSSLSRFLSKGEQ